MSKAAITPELIKTLRERSGVGMAKCKEALEQAGGDLEKAIDLLRKAGVVSSVKKEGRETKEGVIGTAQSAKAIALVEVRSETDFTSQTEVFRQFVLDLCAQAVETKPVSLEAFIQQRYQKDASLTVDEARNLLVQKFGENIQIKRTEIIAKDANCSYGIYSHMKGKIVTIVELQGASDEEGCAREVAMHVAAESPEFIQEKDIPSDVKAREEDIARSQVQGKPAAVADKIIVGKWKAYCDQACLTLQKFIKDPSLTVAQFVENCGKKKGKTLQVRRFWLWKIGH